MGPDFDIRKDAIGEWYWVFNSANGKVICKSTDGYKNRQDCLHSIRLVKDLAPNAPVWDMSVPGAAKKVPDSEVK